MFINKQYLFGKTEEDSRQSEHTHTCPHLHNTHALQQCKQLFQSISKYLHASAEMFPNLLTTCSYSVLNDCQLTHP